MKLESLEIVGLHGSDQTITLDFNDDLNIITGKNGAGKTTILKIIWYILSENFSLLHREYNFKKILLKTDTYTAELNEASGSISERKKRDIKSEKSLFFPTHRRIESEIKSNDKNLSNYLEEQSKILSTDNHHYISFVGTQDIELLYYKKNSENTNSIRQLNDGLSQVLKFYQDGLTDSPEFLNIESKTEELRNQMFQKSEVMDLFRDTVSKFINHSNIALTDSKDGEIMVVNDVISTINSDLLSAGEKQMLSFIAYNAFYENTIFIIDEPELSLHGDWQRQLIPTLLKQGTNNQFILATHSPFIYSKYPDKEIRLVADRGHNADNTIVSKQHG